VRSGQFPAEPILVADPSLEKLIARGHVHGSHLIDLARSLPLDAIIGISGDIAGGRIVANPASKELAR